MIAADRKEKQAQDACAAERRQQEREWQRIPQAIDALRRSGPLEDRTADEVWLDLLARLLDALRDAQKVGLLDKLPERGDARRFTRRCIELLTAGRRRKALALLTNIGPGKLDAELACERNADLPDDLCRLLDLPIPQPSPTKGMSDQDVEGEVSTMLPRVKNDPEAGPPKPEAVWLGKGRVRIGDETLSLEPQFADVLEALVGLGAAMKPDLQKRSGRDEPGRLLNKLVRKFPRLRSYIVLPGRRGKGGYRTTIRAEK